MKYKKLYLESKKKIADLEYNLTREQQDRFDAETNARSFKEAFSRFEGRESDLRRENEWLKTTLRMVIIDGEKIKMIARELDKNEMKFEYKF